MEAMCSADGKREQVQGVLAEEAVQSKSGAVTSDWSDFSPVAGQGGGGIVKDICTLISIAAPVVVDAFAFLCDALGDFSDVCSIIVDGVSAALQGLCAVLPHGDAGVARRIEALTCRALTASRPAAAGPETVRTDCVAITGRHPQASMQQCENVFAELAKMQAMCPAGDAAVLV